VSSAFVAIGNSNGSGNQQPKATALTSDDIEVTVTEVRRPAVADAIDPYLVPEVVKRHAAFCHAAAISFKPLRNQTVQLVKQHIAKYNVISETETGAISGKSKKNASVSQFNNNFASTAFYLGGMLAIASAAFAIGRFIGLKNH
jgi:hypothetical protein